MRWLLGAGGVVVVLAVGAGVVRLVRARKGRRDRVVFALLPAPDFSVTQEEVIRFAGQLQRARRASGMMHPNDANSVRFRFQSVGTDMVSSISLGSQAAPGIRRSVYPGVEVRLLSEVLEDEGGGDENLPPHGNAPPDVDSRPPMWVAREVAP